MKLDDEASSLKKGENWLNDGKANISLVFEVGRGLEDRIISKVFLLIMSWKCKSKVLLGPDIFFELEDEIEGKWLEPVFKVDEDSVGRLNADGGSSLRWLVNLEEEWWDEWLKSSLTIEVTFRMHASKAEGSESISNEGFEVEEMVSCEV